MITIDLENLVSLEKMFKTFPERTAEAARLAINQTAKREALSRVRQDMRKQINWKASYLNDPDKTGVAKYATKGSLVAAIYARDQPTMLNRFRPNPNTMPSKTTSGVKVKVKPTSTKVMKHAFAHQFRKSGNIGILTRTKGGGSTPPSGITHGGGRYIQSMRAWLLYAPSVDQVMWDTAKRNQARIAKYLEVEFLRQFNRLEKL